jgi:hypothetical protein
MPCAPTQALLLLLLLPASLRALHPPSWPLCPPCCRRPLALSWPACLFFSLSNRVETAAAGPVQRIDRRRWLPAKQPGTHARRILHLLHFVLQPPRRRRHGDWQRGSCSATADRRQADVTEGTARGQRGESDCGAARFPDLHPARSVQLARTLSTQLPEPTIAGSRVGVQRRRRPGRRHMHARCRCRAIAGRTAQPEGWTRPEQASRPWI